MNRVFLQRSVGAAVLFSCLIVVAALLPAPEPAADEAVDEPAVRIDLRPVAPARPLRVPEPEPSPVVVAPATDPVPEQVRETRPESTPEPEPDPAPKADPAPPPAAEPAPAPVPESGAPTPGPRPWRVQVASFSEVERARRVIADFGRLGLPTQRETVSVGGRQVHRVILGPFAEEDAARAAQARAVLEGFPDSRIQRFDD